MGDDKYLLDNRDPAAEQRFGALSELFDPITFARLDALGIRPGWRCWEVGAGGPTLPRWLAERVAPDGHVLATDIDPAWIGDHTGLPVEVWRHDVAADDPPAGGFDLVHARLVLNHVAGRDRALAHMVQVLRPGGVLLIEDFDMTLQPLARLDPYRPEHHLANKVRRGFGALLAQRGVDLEYGRKPPRLLAEQGLSDVSADAYHPVALRAMDRLEISNVRQVRDQLIAQGHVTAEEVEAHLANVERGLGLASPPLISAWGRKPWR